MAPELFLWVGVALLLAAAVVGAVTAARPDESAAVRGLAFIERDAHPAASGSTELPAADRLVLPAIERFRRLGLAVSPAGTSNRLARGLDVAGNPPEWTLERVLAVKGILAIVGVFAGLVLGRLSLSGLLLAAGLAAGGLFLPDLLVYNLGLKRQDQLRRSLAEAMDMLTVCMEAGQGFDGGMLQVARSVDGPVAGEFARILSEVQLGKSRGEAFTALGLRTTVPEIKTFVSAVVQADRLGLPIANVLREQAREMRLARRQHAEEQAQKVPVKILFPMLFCIFPALMIVVIGPGAIRMMGMFASMGG